MNTDEIKKEIKRLRQAQFCLGAETCKGGISFQELEIMTCDYDKKIAALEKELLAQAPHQEAGSDDQ